MEKQTQNGDALPSHDLLSLGLAVEDAAKELLAHAMEFRDDWRKGDFRLPSLAQCDMESMETKFEPLWDALKAVANYRLRHRINLRDNVKDHSPIGAVSASKPESKPAAPIG